MLAEHVELLHGNQTRKEDGNEASEDTHKLESDEDEPELGSVYHEKPLWSLTSSKPQTLKMLHKLLWRSLLREWGW